MGDRSTLPRSTRLGGFDAVSRVFRSGDGLRRGDVVARYFLGEPRPGAPVRVAFAVRRGKWSKPRRNRLKRLLREAYRHCRQSFERDVLPLDVTIDLVLLWSGSDEDARMASFPRTLSCVEAALSAVVRRLRTRPNDTEQSR